jgi:hypothetical protein
VRLDEDELQPGLQRVGRSLHPGRIDLSDVVLRGTALQHGASADGKSQEARKHIVLHDPEHWQQVDHCETSLIVTRHSATDSINKPLCGATLMALAWVDLIADGDCMFETISDPSRLWHFGRKT